MSRELASPMHPDRRDFLKTASAAAAGALILPRLTALAETPGVSQAANAALAGWTVRPFASGAVSCKALRIIADFAELHRDPSVTLSARHST